MQSDAKPEAVCSLFLHASSVLEGLGPSLLSWIRPYLEDLSKFLNSTESLFLHPLNQDFSIWPPDRVLGGFHEVTNLRML